MFEFLCGVLIGAGVLAAVYGLIFAFYVCTFLAGIGVITIYDRIVQYFHVDQAS